jgi:predicted GIY-YIG superfamily endonuclease
MPHLTFLGRLKDETAPLNDFWKMKVEDIPPSSGVYIFLAKPGLSFQYPRNKSPIYYIGQATNLRQRLNEHFTYSYQAKYKRVRERYWPRYEYTASFGGRYTVIQTWQGMTSKSLERKILNLFADKYRSFPIANGAGSWDK